MIVFDWYWSWQSMYCQLELGFMEIAAVYCSEEMLGLFSSCSSSSNLAQCLGI